MVNAEHTFQRDTEEMSDTNMVIIPITLRFLIVLVDLVHGIDDVIVLTECVDVGMSPLS